MNIPMTFKLIRKIVPPPMLKLFKRWRFNESELIYKGVSYRDFLAMALQALRPDLKGKEKRDLLIDIKDVYLADGTRPDEYLLYGYDHKDISERASYLPQKLKDSILLDYYKPYGYEIVSQLRDKYNFYVLSKHFFKRDVVRIKSDEDLQQFMSFCELHPRFICKIIDSGCGVGIRVEEVQCENQVKSLFQELVSQGSWMIEEIIEQDDTIAAFNNSSVNTVRFPSFKHGSSVIQNYPCIRFGREGSIVDNAGQGGVFASVDINDGTIVTNGFDELGNEYTNHPDSGAVFKGFVIPQWQELLNEAKLAHLALPENQTYVAFDFALSKKGWVIVEGNWGDFVLQQVALRKGFKHEFLQLLEGK